MNIFRRTFLTALLSLSCGSPLLAQDAPPQWLTFDGEGPGKGKHIVFLTGDEEYRGEEAAPMLARILSQRHGFRTTVLFSIDKEKGVIDPNTKNNIPGLEALDTADMAVLMLRFRELPDDRMKHIVDFVKAGKPIMAVRTSTHAFAYTTLKERSPYAKWDWQSSAWPGGFGQQIVGETWVRHHGDHGTESTRGIINPEEAAHPILRGVKDIWGPTDVYGVDKLPPETKILVRGQVLKGMTADSAPVEGPKNQPLQPLIWVKDYQYEDGKPGKAVGTTIGAAVDLESEGLRRLFINTAYWATGVEVPAAADVSYTGEYKPSAFGFNKFKVGVKVADLVNTK